MLLEHQRLCNIANAAAAGLPRPPDHPPFAIPLPRYPAAPPSRSDAFGAAARVESAINPQTSPSTSSTRPASPSPPQPCAPSSVASCHARSPPKAAI
eukprot:2789854-Pleurochrysis_carterae.AAC.1